MNFKSIYFVLEFIIKTINLLVTIYILQNIFKDIFFVSNFSVIYKIIDDLS